MIIGGGASGLMAAIAAVENGKKVILLEKNDQVGKKLLITGKGRCNVTNFSDVKEHIANIVNNGKFMHNAYHQYFVKEVMDFFESENVPLKIERGNRVFPVSDKAKDIVDCLYQKAQTLGVSIFKEHVLSIEKKDATFIIQTQSGKTYHAESVILCTGGASYPGTGSTGDGFRWAKKFGHQVQNPKAALVPMLVKELDTVQRLQGLSLRNVEISIINSDDKIIFQDFGEMLFTHFGVSGPLILTASSFIDNCDNCKLNIDLKPALTEEQLHSKIQRIIEDSPKKQFKSILPILLPRLFIPVFIASSSVPESHVISNLTKQQRNTIVFLLKHFTLTLAGFAPLKEAIITRGGVSVSEINPKTMESKLVEGLFFAGELIDVDALTGGFNLQIAFSTGYVTGTHC
jgi:predicted Rossmann fold flavoprotein